MLRRVDDVVLLDDIIKKIKYSHTKEKVFLELANSNITVEFKNGKKNRADTIKKMKLDIGESVIIIGAKSDSSQLYVFGWELKREGFVKKGSYYLIKGTLDKMVETGKNSLLYIKNENNLTPLLLENKKKFYIGDKISAVCFSFEYGSCLRPCKGWYKGKCDACKNGRKEKRYIALDIRRNLS